MVGMPQPSKQEEAISSRRAAHIVAVLLGQSLQKKQNYSINYGKAPPFFDILSNYSQIAAATSRCRRLHVLLLPSPLLHVVSNNFLCLTCFSAI